MIPFGYCRRRQKVIDNGCSKTGSRFPPDKSLFIGKVLTKQTELRKADSTVRIKCYVFCKINHAIRWIVFDLVPVVQRLDNAIQRINHYNDPADKC